MNGVEVCAHLLSGFALQSTCTLLCRRSVDSGQLITTTQGFFGKPTSNELGIFVVLLVHVTKDASHGCLTLLILRKWTGGPMC
jgi:hypothetical protein